jgi:phosphate transport system permease protein
MLLAFVTVPVALLLGACLWQLLPQDVSVRLAGWPRLVAILALLPVAIWLAAMGGAGLERALFAGDMRAWLDGQVGSGFGGWVVIVLPIAALAVTFFVGRVVGPAIRARSAGWSRRRAAVTDLLRFVGALALTGVVCWLLARGLDVGGFDPRGGFLGTYVQRNALIVGFVMGFAVIPIIYTLAEDALSAVPDHLRAASLASGATRWQTATRVIVPTAMSGMFSAVMIGLGRAVGETMVVLMAAGNTPVLDMNVFNGFRTLSATIAVELPEAVRDSTLYRVLFLSALTLFAMTFVINTFAELVRLRFRKRAYEL